MKIIIPTKNRADIIDDKALRLFPDATVCVGDDEVDAYPPAPSAETQPSGRCFLAPKDLRNACSQARPLADTHIPNMGPALASTPNKSGQATRKVFFKFLLTFGRC